MDVNVPIEDQVPQELCLQTGVCHSDLWRWIRVKLLGPTSRHHRSREDLKIQVCLCLCRILLEIEHRALHTLVKTLSYQAVYPQPVFNFILRQVSSSYPVWLSTDSAASVVLDVPAFASPEAETQAWLDARF